MEREQYAIMALREESHWWYAGMRRVALAVLGHALDGSLRAAGASHQTSLLEKRQLRILDAGCGTGGTTVELRQFGEVVGVDLAWEALDPARERGLDHLAQASIEQLPFQDAVFDVATSFEVVYHLGVTNDAAALREMRRVLKPGGLLLLRVPAHDWLRGEHDRLVHTRHRYSRAEVRSKLAAAGFEVEQLSWANTVLFPPAVAKRLLERSAFRVPRSGFRVPRSVSPDTEPDLWQPPPPINAALERAVAIEAKLIPRRVPLPFGLSVLAVARAA